jgi:signal peptidase I
VKVLKSIRYKVLINRTVSVILFATLLLMLFIVISSKTSGGKTHFFGYQLMTVLSGSMEPGIKTGSIIAIKPTDDQSKYQKGDVITFRALDQPNILITHRIVEVQKEGSNLSYITKGDNNDAKDVDPIPSKNVVGEYVEFTVPYVGYFLSFAKSDLGNIFLLIVPGALLIIYSLYSAWKAISAMEEKKKLETNNSLLD